RLLRRREIEARAFAEVVSRVVRHIVAARRSVRRNHHEPECRSRALQPGFGHHVLPRARQAGQVPKDRNALRLRLRRREHREAHVATASLRRMLEDRQCSVEAAPTVFLEHPRFLSWHQALSTPLVLATCVAIASINGGDSASYGSSPSSFSRARTWPIFAGSK